MSSLKHLLLRFTCSALLAPLYNHLLRINKGHLFIFILYWDVKGRGDKLKECLRWRIIIIIVIRGNNSNLGEQGWRSGESARLPPMWPGFNSRSRCHMWVEFVVGSHPCSERFFSGCSGFPLSSKTCISKFQFDLEPEGHRFVSPRLVGVTLVKQS